MGLLPPTLADVPVGGVATLAGPASGAAQRRRLAEFGLRPGARVRVLMRTAGGGRVLGVEAARIAVDRVTLAELVVVPDDPAGGDRA